MRDWYARAVLRHELLHTILAREPDGVISAITDTSWAPHRPTIIDQRFTGVRALDHHLDRLGADHHWSVPVPHQDAGLPQRLRDVGIPLVSLTPVASDGINPGPTPRTDEGN